MANQTTSEKTEIIIEEGENGLVVSAPAGVNITLKQEKEEPVAKVPTKLDNLLTIGLVGLLALVAAIAIIRKAVADKKSDAQVIEEAPAPVAETPKAPGSAGQLKLHNVEPKTAAMLMAITADKLGKPLNELRFTSIKEVEE